MNLNVYAVTYGTEDGDFVVVGSYLTHGEARALAIEYRELGYDDVRVECWA